MLGIAILNNKSDLAISYGNKNIIIKHKELLDYLGKIGDAGKKLSSLPKLSSSSAKTITLSKC